jgi:hypothetical protein
LPCSYLYFKTVFKIIKLFSSIETLLLKVAEGKINKNNLIKILSNKIVKNLKNSLFCYSENRSISGKSGDTVSGKYHPKI